jgi:hypothetical protein
MAAVEAPARPRVALFVTDPAKLTGWSWESGSVATDDLAGASGSNLRAYYARMAARFRSMPRLAHHEHGPSGEIEPF